MPRCTQVISWRLAQAVPVLRQAVLVERSVEVPPVEVPETVLHVAVPPVEIPVAFPPVAVPSPVEVPPPIAVPPVARSTRRAAKKAAKAIKTAEAEKAEAKREALKAKREALKAKREALKAKRLENKVLKVKNKIKKLRVTIENYCAKLEKSMTDFSQCENEINVLNIAYQKFFNVVPVVTTGCFEKFTIIKTNSGIIIFPKMKEKCIICMTNDNDCVLMQCNHNVLCTSCTLQIIRLDQKCPVCRATIFGYVKIHK